MYYSYKKTINEKNKKKKNNNKLLMIEKAIY